MSKLNKLIKKYNKTFVKYMVEEEIQYREALYNKLRVLEYAILRERMNKVKKRH